MMILLLLLLLLVMMRLLFLFFLPTRNLCKMYFDADEKTKIELKRLIKHESLKGNRWGQLRLQVKMRQQSCLRQTHINPNPQLSVSYIICSKGFLFLFNHRALSSSILLSFTENFHLFFFFYSRLYCNSNSFWASIFFYCLSISSSFNAFCFRRRSW